MNAIFKNYLKLFIWQFFMIFTVLFLCPIMLQLATSQAFKSHKILTSISMEQITGTHLLSDIALFLAAVIFIHVIFAGMIWMYSCFLSTIFSWIKKRLFFMGTLISLLSVLWCFLINARFYPNSYYAVSITSLGEILLFAIPILFIVSIIAPLIYLATSGLTRRRLVASIIAWKLGNTEYRLFGCNPLCFGLLMLIVVFSFILTIETPANLKSMAGIKDSLEKRPNVILIGIDSLRPDQIKPFSPDGDSVLPNIEEFISKSAYIETVYTPLARTYPSWTTILTGAYPTKHGARFNLISKEYLNPETKGLAHNHRQNGYKTIYATDEKRFSNIDENNGFDLVIGPAIGAGDFLIGNFNDLPLSNLLSNSPASRILFPYTYSNRAASATYYPQTFIDLLSDTLPIQSKQPLFVCVHLCLPHVPYTWAGSDPNTVETEDSKSLYLSAMNEVDRQFKALIDLMQNKNYFSNAIVAVLSDHGESFFSDNFLYAQPDGKLSNPMRMETFGHGTSVFSREQYRVILAFRGFGPNKIQPGLIKQTANLVDIAPTIISYNHIDYSLSNQFDGISLKPWLDNHALAFIERSFFLESGFSVPAILSNSPDMMEAFSQGAAYYTVSKNGKVIIRPDAISLLMDLKQLALYFGPLTYAVLPDRMRTRGFREVVIDHDKREVVTNIDKIKVLRKIFCQQYKNENAIKNNGICTDS